MRVQTTALAPQIGLAGVHRDDSSSAGLTDGRTRMKEVTYNAAHQETKPAAPPSQRSPHTARVNMISPKGKEPIHGPESPTEEKTTRGMLRLCTCYKAEMTGENWDALLIHIPEEVEKWFAFIYGSEGIDHRDRRSDQGLVGGFDRQSSEEEGKEEEHALSVRGARQTSLGRERPRVTQSTKRGHVPHSNDEAPATTTSRAESRGHPEDLLANKPEGDQHTGSCNTQQGSGHTRGSDRWGHREALLVEGTDTTTSLSRNAGGR